MAVAPQVSTFEIVDLRLLPARALAALLAEEERDWRTQLHWDYRPSVEMIRRHVEGHTLPGYVALRRGQTAGYCFFVYEDEKGLIGDVYVREPYRREKPRGDRRGIASLLLERALEALQNAPVVRRIETQLICFDIEPIAAVFLARGFRSFPRLFMYKALGLERAPADEALRDSSLPLLPWDDGRFEAMAELVVASYRDHVDGRINSHYGSVEGALRFLKNIVVFPGCGTFRPDSSWVVVDTVRGRLAGAVLASQVAPRVGHITQLCVRPEWQGKGLGRRLLRAAARSLAVTGSSGVSLTVTAENETAVRLYRRHGFDILKGFAAFAGEPLAAR